MCGIAVVLGENNEVVVREMMARIKHRGPDGEGVGRIGRAALGHVRLAILDAAGGAQPMANERGDLLVTLIRLQDTNLQRADRVSQAHGLEARVPFLDLVRYVCRLPTGLIEPRADRPGKWLLREACRGLLPQNILDRRKMKFSEGTGSSDLA